MNTVFTNTMLNDWTSTKTYASRENLEKAIRKAGLAHVGSILTPEGRHTAIFGKSFVEAAGLPVMTPAHLGFKVLG
jgi:hypothetical protein